MCIRDSFRPAGKTGGGHFKYVFNSAAYHSFDRRDIRVLPDSAVKKSDWGRKRIKMDNLFTYSLYGVTAVLLAISYVKDRNKTMLSLKRAWKMFINVLPQFISILFLAGLLLAAVSPETIQYVIGTQSGFRGMLTAALLGAVTLVPVLVAFPVAARLLQNGAGVTQTAVFISTLTMVGFVTLPMEIKYLGKKAAVLRNALAFLFSFAAAFLIGVLLT